MESQTENYWLRSSPMTVLNLGAMSVEQLIQHRSLLEGVADKVAALYARDLSAIDGAIIAATHMGNLEGGD